MNALKSSRGCDTSALQQQQQQQQQQQPQQQQHPELQQQQPQQQQNTSSSSRLSINKWFQSIILIWQRRRWREVETETRCWPLERSFASSNCVISQIIIIIATEEVTSTRRWSALSTLHSLTLDVATFTFVPRWRSMAYGHRMWNNTNAEVDNLERCNVNKTSWNDARMSCLTRSWQLTRRRMNRLISSLGGFPLCSGLLFLVYRYPRVARLRAYMPESGRGWISEVERGKCMENLERDVARLK